MKPTLITLTHDRPVAFNICERLMSVQTVPVTTTRWIVVSDGLEPPRCKLGQELIERQPGLEGFNSFQENLSTALDAVEPSAPILFIEDDDWYASNYVELMLTWLEHFQAVGEASAKYYNVRSRRFKVMNNGAHASLCQTGFVGVEALNKAKACIRSTKEFYDVTLWRSLNKLPSHLWPTSTISVGMKALPGTRGLGVGHRLNSTTGSPDPDCTHLRSWIGDDWTLYKSFAFQ